MKLSRHSIYSLLILKRLGKRQSMGKECPCFQAVDDEERAGEVPRLSRDLLQNEVLYIPEQLCSQPATHSALSSSVSLFFPPPRNLFIFTPTFAFTLPCPNVSLPLSPYLIHFSLSSRAQTKSKSNMMLHRSYLAPCIYCSCNLVS